MNCSERIELKFGYDMVVYAAMISNFSSLFATSPVIKLEKEETLWKGE